LAYSNHVFFKKTCVGSSNPTASNLGHIIDFLKIAPNASLLTQVATGDMIMFKLASNGTARIKIAT